MTQKRNDLSEDQWQIYFDKINKFNFLYLKFQVKGCDQAFMLLLFP